mmetsp:Transcript_1194/g.2773  ORF Transcript_1194/g.2773 Transcript_1194/m.2773 type:complete len:334 (+) Transcript_1194:81-1082(+)
MTTTLWLLVLAPAAVCFRASAASADTTETLFYPDGKEEWCSRYQSCPDCVAYSIPSLARREESLHNNASQSTIHRVMTEERCAWDPINDMCVDVGGKLGIGNTADEQVEENTYSFITSMSACRSWREEQLLATFLPNWMGTLLNMTSDPVAKEESSSSSSSHRMGFGNLTILDICLPGTHDTLSYDLSLEISDDGLDMYTRLDSILHYFSGGAVQLLPGDIESFLRDQSMTQRLDVTAQLNGGVRFLDVRITLEDQGGQEEEEEEMHCPGLSSPHLQRLLKEETVMAIRRIRPHHRRTFLTVERPLGIMPETAATMGTTSILPPPPKLTNGRR